MKNWAALTVLALTTLAGCQSKSPAEMNYSELKQYGTSLMERCRKQGVKRDAEMQACINQEALSDHAKRQQANETRQAIGMAMAGVGQGMQAAAAQQAANRPVTCSSVPSSTWVGGPVSQVRTTCY
ncbi:hypothetical protein [Mesorhizobium sp. 1M-11]|uniref:hypothetical protein n=1 Tax=Mesorhizobium sp. 1M-11 TaxID=1529006 RepID=UPI000AD64F50|nr:hypothetical protein [Mesorhizobium sp. 1M-11]